jgi:hypothetical protein
MSVGDSRPETISLQTYSLGSGNAVTARGGVVAVGVGGADVREAVAVSGSGLGETVAGSVGVPLGVAAAGGRGTQPTTTQQAMTARPRQMGAD